MDLNSSPPPFSELDHHISDDHHLDSCHIFFKASRDHPPYDYDRHQLYRPQHQTVHENYGYEDDGSAYEIENRVDGGLNLTLWKKEEESLDVEKNDINPVKWMSSKMRLMQKMKISSKSENQKLQKSSSSESTDLSSNSLPSYNNNSPIRVCADCNTTKTPLWRSGPKGPKSLCNACGIRQRKARRAMAAANGTAYQPVPAMKIKLQHKEKSVAARNGHKKRFKTTTNSTRDHKNNGFEDFLINLSKKLSFHRVFPEDEKNAAILLMALSSGLVHG